MVFCCFHVLFSMAHSKTCMEEAFSVTLRQCQDAYKNLTFTTRGRSLVVLGSLDALEALRFGDRTEK